IVIGFDEAITTNKSDLNSVISITGTVSGVHFGDIILTGDKKKIIFNPHELFAYNEKISVNVKNINTLSSSGNKLNFTFETQVRKLEEDNFNSFYSEFGNLFNPIKSGSFDLPDSLPSLNVTVSNNPSPGDLYLSNFPIGSTPNIPYLITANNSGNIIYSKQMNGTALDYKKQHNGFITYFTGGKFFAEDLLHNIVDTFTCGNGYSTDGHELKILNNGHALLMSYDRQPVDMSQIVPGGDTNAIVIGLIIQELDENKNVVFQWRSWDHFNITDAPFVDMTGSSIDYAHGNAIEYDNDGNLLISSRHLNEITKINRTTGDIIWRLGGVNNEFTIVNDTIPFQYQHHIRRISNGNITLFDNGNFREPFMSRALEYQLDEENKIATLVWSYIHNPVIYGSFMGSVQRLRNGNTLIGWGGNSTKSLTEVTPNGEIALEMTLPLSPGVWSYRAFRDEVNLTLNAKIAIEGFYNDATDQLNMNDTVRAYVRSSSSPFGIVDSALSVVDSVNFNGNFRFYNVPDGTYYVSTKHRNGLETWSKAGGEAFVSGGVYQYDFTSAAANSYGSNAVLKGSKYCFYSGDVNQDGNINVSDVLLISNDAANNITGYVNTDVNGDNVTDLSDILITYNNAINFVSKMTP
ncbi:MAG: aryl-sulfate sulfotransferase, partial [Ignavibacteriae bacterium]|nr:aryl-sulfate sulfotransferase [Ignavibacteriota bacterium]